MKCIFSLLSVWVFNFLCAKFMDGRVNNNNNKENRSPISIFSQLFFSNQSDDVYFVSDLTASWTNNSFSVAILFQNQWNIWQSSQCTIIIIARLSLYNHRAKRAITFAHNEGAKKKNFECQKTMCQYLIILRKTKKQLNFFVSKFSDDVTLKWINLVSEGILPIKEKNRIHFHFHFFFSLPGIKCTLKWWMRFQNKNYHWNMDEKIYCVRILRALQITNI